MSSPWKKKPEVVADKVLKRAEVSKVIDSLSITSSLQDAYNEA